MLALMLDAVQETLTLLEGLSKERFQILLTNWYRATKGKFKVPIFAHQELDLHKVFWEVQNRGGSQLVTDQKMWKVRLPLPVDCCGPVLEQRCNVGHVLD